MVVFFIVVIHLIVTGPKGNVVVNVLPESTVYGNLKQCREAIKAIRTDDEKTPEIGCEAVELRGEHGA